MLNAEQIQPCLIPADYRIMCFGANSDYSSGDVLYHYLSAGNRGALGGRSVDIEPQRIAILSSGIWQLRDAVREITQMEPVRWMPPLKRPVFGCVAGWGLKQTAKRARALASKNDVAFLALEDGFIRSICPGADNAPVSLVADRTGIHYDATAASDLEALIEASATNVDAARLKRAAAGLQVLQRKAISKYNHAPRLSESDLGLTKGRRAGRVLVVDQTKGDSSIAYGLASPETFREMLGAAKAENPMAEILVKQHPEVVSGRKQGHLVAIDDRQVKLIDHDVNPWSLIDIVDKVYVVTSQLGFEAAMARKHVVCFGAPFYAGWGLTDDRQPIARRSARPTLEQLFAAVYFDYSRYVSPDTKREISFEAAVEWIAHERREYWAAST